MQAGEARECVYIINRMGREVEEPRYSDGSKSGLQSWSVLYVVVNNNHQYSHNALHSCNAHEGMGEGRMQQSLPVCLQGH